MDSGNSGSMNSSSAGDDEYDSRATAAAATHNLSSFLNTSSFLSSSTSHNPPPPPPTLFDPFSHSYNLDPVWPDPAHHQNYQNTLPAQFGPTTGPPPGPSSEPIPSSKPVNVRPDQPGLGPIKNPRKRTRASRRAPTTVLTTDTSNFRQMVQEFTGIPAPPFSASSSSLSSPYSRRLDLFGQLYPFRPSALKVPSTTNIANATPDLSTIATPGTNSNTIFSTPSYNNQFLLPNNSFQNQILANQSLMFGSSKSTTHQENNSLVEMGITQDHINANISVFLSDKGIGRENNEENTAINATRNEENAINSWNYSQGL